MSPMPGTITVYYTDASRTSVVCNDSTCDGTTCEPPTPYTRTVEICCIAN